MRLRLRKYRILEILESRGIFSIKDLAAQLNVDPTNLSTLLNNKTNFTRETLERLIEMLDCELGDVLELQVDKKQEER
jgi:DNA-binding Xre family transcriptional regulator